MKPIFTFLCALTITAGCITRPPTILNRHEDLISFNGMAIIFEDAEIPFCIQKKIANDYKTVLRVNEPKGMIRVGNQTIHIHDTNITITHTLNFSDEGENLPYDYDNQFGVVGQSDDGRKLLVVSKHLSDGYRNAIELMNLHSSAFSSVINFVELLNTMNRNTLPSIDQLLYLYGDRAEESTAEMIHSANANDETRDQYIEKFVDTFGGYHYALGSILDVHNIDGRPAVRLDVQDKSTEKRIHMFHIIFDEGKWKMLIVML